MQKDIQIQNKSNINCIYFLINEKYLILFYLHIQNDIMKIPDESFFSFHWNRNMFDTFVF